LAGLINAILTLFTIAIFARVILTFIIPLSGARPHPILVTINTFVFQVTEPVLGPIRRSLPSFGGFDFSPMAVLIILILLRKVVDSVL
jgi:YggT family protein|tara:strand:- start:410 stop:673 length:264 start_codon:yes stop_codon:yes gene_type:complete